MEYFLIKQDFPAEFNEVWYDTHSSSSNNGLFVRSLYQQLTLARKKPVVNVLTNDMAVKVRELLVCRFSYDIEIISKLPDFKKTNRLKTGDSICVLDLETMETEGYYANSSPNIHAMSDQDREEYTRKQREETAKTERNRLIDRQFGSRYKAYDNGSDD